VLGDKSVVTDYSRVTRLKTRPSHRLHAGYDHQSRIFKAYDVRGLYPTEINEDAPACSAAPSSPTSGAGRIAVSRDMRLSSPAVAAAFIEGAREQGADVVDYGMMAPTCCTSPSPRRARRRRADHRVAQPEASTTA
jgi:hypothetical protein